MVYRFGSWGPQGAPGASQQAKLDVLARATHRAELDAVIGPRAPRARPMQCHDGAALKRHGL